MRSQAKPWRGRVSTHDSMDTERLIGTLGDSKLMIFLTSFLEQSRDIQLVWNSSTFCVGSQ